MLLSPSEVLVWRRLQDSNLHPQTFTFPDHRPTFKHSADRLFKSEFRNDAHLWSSRSSDPLFFSFVIVTVFQIVPPPPVCLALLAIWTWWRLPPLNNPFWHCPSGSVLYLPLVLTPACLVLLGNLTAMMQTTGNLWGLYVIFMFVLLSFFCRSTPSSFMESGVL